MKKNLLFSLIAVSAPMAAYADANVGLDVNKGSQAWSTEDGTSFVLEKDSIASSAAHVTRQITLLPGTYRLSAKGKSNAILQFTNDKKWYSDKREILADDGQDLVLKEETTLWVRVGAKQGGRAFNVSGLKLTLVYDFAAQAGKQLEVLLGYAGNELASTGKFEAELTEESSRLANEILKIQKLNNKDNAYQAYKDNKFYTGDVNQYPLAAEIKALDARVKDAVEKVKLYNAANAAIQTAEANINSLNWAKQPEYLTTKYKSQYDALVKYVADFKAGVDAYDTNAQYADKYNAEKTKAFTEKAKKDFDALNVALNGGQQDDAAFKEVSEKINAANAKHLAYVQELVALMGQDKELAPVYENMRSEAQSELAKVYDKVVACSALDKNGTKESHDQAAETKEANLKVIAEAEAQMEAVKNDYVKKYNENIAAYKAEVEVIAGYRKQLDAQKEEQLNEEAKKLKAEANELIAAFEKTVVADHAAYKSAAADYAQAKAGIEAKLKAFAEKAGLDVANFEAHARLVKLQGEKQKEFDKTKGEVNALVSKDKKYAVNGKYAKAEEDLQKKLTDYKTAIDKTAKEGAVAYETANKSAIEGLSAEFKTYKDNAANALKHYDEVAARLVAQNDTVNDLRNLVKDNDKVIVKVSGKTYGEEVVALQARIDTAQKHLDEALKLLGEEHRTALNKVVPDANIETEVTALLKSYDADKKDYDDQQSVNAAKAVQTTISNKIKEATDCLAEIRKTCTKELLGLRLTEVTDSLAKIETKIEAENKKNSVDITVENALERLAALNGVSVTVDAIKTELNNYNEKVIKVIKANLKANNDKYKELASAVDPKGKLVLYKERLAKVASKDADHEFTKGEGKEAVKVTVNGQKAALNNDLTKLLNDINASNAKEAVVADSKDTVDKDGKVTKKGFDSRLADVLKGITEVENLAKTADANLAAKDAVQKLLEDKDFATLKKNADAAAAKATGKAKDYYVGVVAEYQKTLDQIQKDITKAYNDNKSVALQSALESRINNLAVNFADVVTDVPANEEAHKVLVESAKTTEDKWSEAYNYVMEHDKTSKRQEHLDALAAVQKKVIDNKLAVEDDFAKGLSVDKKVERQNVYNAAQAEIATIMATQDPDKYNPVVLADNKLYLEEFEKLVGESRASFKVAAETIRKYNSEIVHEKLQTALGPVIEANKGIFEYGTALDKFDADVHSAWNKCVAETPDVIFDAPKANLQKAKDQKADIDAAVAKLQKEANAVVAKFMQSMYDDAKGQLDRALDEMTRLRVDKGIIEKSFADVKALLKATDPSTAPKNDANYALTCDKQVDDFENVPDWIEDGKYESYEQNWKLLDAKYSKTIKEQRDTLSNLAFLPSYIAANGQPLENYNAMVERTFDQATEIVAEYGAYSQMARVNSLLDEFDASTIYADAKAAALDKSVNDEKLQILNDSLSVSGLAELQAYALEYVVGGQKTWMAHYDYLTGRVNGLSAEFKADYNNGNLSTASCFEGRKAEIKKLAEEIATYYQKADDLEYGYLVEQLGLLRGEYNSAVGEGNLSGEERAAFETRINNLDKKLKDAAKVVKEKVNHKVYMECEAEIAIMLTDLRNYFNAQSIVDATAALNTSYSKVLGQYNDAAKYLASTHAKVQKRMQAGMDAVKTDLDAVKAMLDGKIADRTVLFFQTNIQLALENVAADIDAENMKDADAQRPYDVHQEVYSDKSYYLQKSSDELARVSKLVEEWGLTGEFTENYGANLGIRSIQETIDLDRNGNKELKLEGLESWYKHDQDKEEIDTDLLDYRYQLISEISGVNLYDEVSVLEKNASQRYIANGFNSINRKLSEAVMILGNNIFADNDKKALTELNKTYLNAYLNASNYNDNILNGYTEVDINGNKYVEGEYVDYYETYQAVIAKEAELNKALDSLLVDIELKRVVVGDMDNDKNVHINDYSAVLKAALGGVSYEPTSREFLCADVDGSGEINIGDVTAMVNFVRGISRTTSAMYLHPLSAAPVMSDNIMLSVEGEGVNQRIAINLNNANSFVGAQMDIYLPEGVRLVGESCGDRAANHELYSNDLENGAHRIILSSMENAEFSGNEGAVIYLDVEVSHNYNGAGISVKDVMFTDAAARLFNLDSLEGEQATGINKVTLGESVVNKVYNVGGQLMNGIQKGVNIIMMKDGSVKKVLKK